MDPKIRELLKPEVLNTINGLELIARIIVEGFMSGGNKSQTIGSGQEFSQYRHYEPGDDLRQLDWKIYARAERFFIKQSEVETNITVNIVIDASASMGYEEDGVSKINFAKSVAAALGYLGRKQGDTVGLYAANAKQVTMLEPRYAHQHFMRFLHLLAELQPAGQFDAAALKPLMKHEAKELIIVLTDFYDNNEDLQAFIRYCKTTRNEIVVLHLLGKKETNLDFGATFTFRDLETEAEVKVDTLAQRQAYTQRVTQWTSALRLSMLENNISYFLVDMNDPISETLRHFLMARKRLV